MAPAVHVALPPVNASFVCSRSPFARLTRAARVAFPVPTMKAEFGIGFPSPVVSCLQFNETETTEPDLNDLPQGQTVHRRLIGAIRVGVFRPGDRMPETGAAQRLSLSRTPMRKALSKLEIDGIPERRACIGP